MKCKCPNCGWEGDMEAVSGVSEGATKMVDDGRLLERDGRKYEVNSETPFTGIAVSSYPKKQRKFEVEYREGIPYGKVTVWYENGQKKMEGEYAATIDGGDLLPIGKDMAWYENGRKAREREYRNDMPIGKHMSWYENGRLETEVEYQDGKPIGMARAWFENGKMKSEAEYQDGKPIGKQSIWYENGQLAEETEYGEGSTRHKLTRFYPNGKKWIEAEYRGDVLVNEVCWDMNGNPQERKVVDESELNWKSEYKGVPFTGTAFIIYSVHVNRVQGKVRLMDEIEYQEGEKSGGKTTWSWNDSAETVEAEESRGEMRKTTLWFASGEKWFERGYRGGKKQGKWTTWHMNGHIDEEGEYEDDRQTGKWTSWWPDGKKRCETDYSFGIVKCSVEWDQNGNLKK